MITAPDFSKKQIVFVFCINGEKFQIRNDNLVVTNDNGQTKLQISCYRLFAINIIGDCSLTSVLIKKANKFGFFIALFSVGFHLNQIIGEQKQGNTILKQKQYLYKDLFLAQHIVKNKIAAQYSVLNDIRIKDNYLKECLSKIKEYYYEIDFTLDFQSLLSYEGLTAKLYFKNIFNDEEWKGRKPRLKCDYINSTLDIGYTILFNFIDSVLNCFGFDTYCGVYHKQFYMRKSLTCDLIEPFRIYIDKEVRKAINLKQISEKDFDIVNNQYKLKWKQNQKYIQILMNPIIENKDLIFKYIQTYYRSFMKEKSADEFPFVLKEGIINGSYKL